MARHSDILIVGAGVVGLTIAMELARRRPGASVRVIDKEPRVGAHASGRNSGVLHAGFYYGADSLKARLCRDGNRRMTEWCRSRGLPLRECGKLVVARHAADLAGLDELRRRGEVNGVPLEMVGAAEARRIEPAARTHERALYSPTTASVDPARVMEALADEARRQGIELCLGTRWLAALGASGARTDQGDMDAGLLINAAGLYADRVAHAYGFGERAPKLRVHVYPVPDLAMPFLGVHFTVTAGGHVKIGPTALPALWRESYGGLGGFDAAELGSILLRDLELLAHDGAFRRHAVTEPTKAWRRVLVRQAAKLCDGIRLEDFTRWGPPGIRAQLFDKVRHGLEMDFVFEHDERSLHVLNAVSPAFTCAFAFAEHLADVLERR